MTFIFTGFRYLEDDRYQPVSLLVTNFQDWDRGYDDPGAWPEFKPLYISPRRDIDWDEFAYVERIGAWPALGETEVAPIRRLVKERRPPAAAVGKAVEVLRRAADHPSCRGSVGKDLLSVVLPADRDCDPSSVFHPVAASEVTYFPNVVDARRGGGIATYGMEFRVESGGTPVAVPKVGRNQPCRCGSGKKYKHCHGR